MGKNNNTIRETTGGIEMKPFNCLLLRNGLFFIAFFSLSACANMPEGNRMRAESAGIGGLIGAAGGAAACKDNRAACAAGFGAGGGFLGYMVGDWQANKIDRMDGQNTYRENHANSLQQHNAKIASYNYQLRGKADQYERNIRRNIYNRKAVNRDLITAQDKRNKLQSVVAQGRQRAARLSNPNQRRSYENQLRQLELQISDLNVSINRLQNIGFYR